MEDNKEHQLVEAERWFEEAKNQEKINCYDKVINLYEKAAFIFENLKIWHTYINCLACKAFCQIDNGMLIEGLQTLNDALSIAEKYYEKKI